MCNALIGHTVKTCTLLPGLSNFEPSALSHSSQDVYKPSFTSLVNYFIASGHLKSSERDVTVSEYQSIASKLQREEVDIPTESISFCSSNSGMQAHPTVLKVFRLSCFCCVYKNPSPPNLV